MPEFENYLEHRIEVLESAPSGALDLSAYSAEGIGLQATTDDGIIIDGSGADGFVIIQAKGAGGIVELDATGGSNDGEVRIRGNKLGFFTQATTPVVQPTGVAVSAAAIHAALVSLGLIAP